MGTTRLPLAGLIVAGPASVPGTLKFKSDCNWLPIWAAKAVAPG
jgi:hypothetical protein